MKTKRTGGHTMTMPGGALFGAALAMAWTLMAAAFVGWLLHSERILESGIGYGSMGILLSASMLGAAVAQRKVQRQRLLAAAGAGGIYFLMLLGLTALFFGGQYTGFGVTALLVMGGSLVTALLAGRQKRGGYPGSRKIRI